MIMPMTVPPPAHPETPSLWPPLAISPTGWLTLTHTPTVEGPWTTQVRSALRVLDPLPGAPTTGAPTPGSPAHDRAPHIRTVADPGLPAEGYALTIDPTGITIAASSPLGALQATTTIRQLLPADAWRTAAVRRDDWRLPTVALDRRPRARVPRVHARRQPALRPGPRGAALDRAAGHAPAQPAAPAPHRRPGVADRVPDLPGPGRGGVLAHRPAGSATARAARPRTPVAWTAPRTGGSTRSPTSARSPTTRPGTA